VVRPIYPTNSRLSQNTQTISRSDIYAVALWLLEIFFKFVLHQMEAVCVSSYDWEIQE
jgi:hypothetical protein